MENITKMMFDVKIQDIVLGMKTGIVVGGIVSLILTVYLAIYLDRWLEEERRARSL